MVFSVYRGFSRVLILVKKKKYYKQIYSIQFQVWTQQQQDNHDANILLAKAASLSK